MSLIRVVFLGTPEIASHCLKTVLGDEHFRVVGVVTQPDRPSGRKLKPQPSAVKTLAMAEQLEVISPEKIKTPEVLSTIAAWKAEAAIVVAYGQILPAQFLDLFPRRVVNVHASLLPRWRGAAPIQRALMEGDKKTGVCLQVMTQKLDAGDVLGQRVIELDDAIDAVELHERMKPLAADLLHVEFMDYLRGHLVPHPQDESLVTYARKLDKDESLIHWEGSAQVIHNQRRGLALGPGVFTFRGGRKLKIIRSQVVERSHGAQPGEVIEVDQDSFVVASGEGALRISMVQPESRAQMSVREYLRGYPLLPGEVFGESSSSLKSQSEKSGAKEKPV